MAEAVILSVIEVMDNWILKMEDLEKHYKNMRSILEKTEREEAKKKETLNGFVIGMMEDFWEEGNKEKLYSLLVKMADPWGNEQGFVGDEKLKLLMAEMTDLWEDDNENLKWLMHAFTEIRRHFTHKEWLYRVLEDIWEGKEIKVNKEKLQSWVANKENLWEGKNLFTLLLEHDQITNSQEWMKRAVESAKAEFRLILDILTEKKTWSYKLHYFVCDVEEMARDAHLLIQIMSSDPFILFLQIFHRQEILYMKGTTCDVFMNKVISIQNGLRETRERMLELGGETSSHKGEQLEGGGEDVVAVGLEEDIKLLLHNKFIGTLTSIRGMVGIGKTTLARELYNHPDVVAQYECRAWVSLSRESSRKEVLIKLIQQVVHESKELERDDDALWLEKMDNKSLQQMLYQQMKGKLYFVVLDDVSESTFLDYVVFEALTEDAEIESRVVFTTRNADIKCTNLEDYTHTMKSLNEDNSWKLLLKTVLFGTSGQELPKYLKEKGKQMLRRCDGLPLAIKEVGMQWAEKRLHGSEWEEVVESASLNRTLMALESTYNNLDSSVKELFLQLGFFKEGITIRAKKLGQMWGTRVVSTRADYVLDYQYYISKLIKESILEVKDMAINNNVRTCRINAVFQRLSITKAENEIGLQIVGRDGHGIGNNQPSHEPRHRVIYCSREKLDYNLNQDKHLVSLFFHGGGYFDASSSYWQQFEQLKILDMDDFGLKILPEAVDRLAKLRYLGLRGNYIQKLPHSLGCLKELEVLDIAQNFMVEVADIICVMYRLRHLYMSDISCKKPLKIDALEQLETMKYISVDNWTFELPRLRAMTRLWKLGIEDLNVNSDVSNLFASLAELVNLQSLSLRGSRFKSMPALDDIGILSYLTQLKLDGLLTELPSLDSFLPNICCLSLVNSCLDEDPMTILGKLSKLEYLKLQNAYTGQQMVVLPYNFKSLKHLVIGELRLLRNIQVRGRALFRVSKLEINSCPYLETPPEDIRKMFSLKVLKIVTTKNIATKFRESTLISNIRHVDIQP